MLAEQSVAPLVRELGEQVEFWPNYIAGEERRAGRVVFNSLHGQPEIDEDIRQLVVARDYPDQHRAYLAARAENYRDDNWQAAAAQAGIDAQAFSRATAQQASQELFRANIKQARTWASAPRQRCRLTERNSRAKSSKPPWRFLDQAALGDYDEDGLADVTVWWAATSTWFIQCSSDGLRLSRP
ncbi:MAG: hypothetical protein HYR56_08820 [Acidobacteria bacterium]|nr:hypothetical protein [Acidobacteriota bacterium]MBI3422722.1 hypothetical protein [Acidobacteriota bacterium]